MHTELGISNLHSSNELFEIIWELIEVVAFAFKGQNWILVLGNGRAGHQRQANAKILLAVALVETIHSLMRMNCRSHSSRYLPP